jgi:hypothetical protein
MPRNATRRIAGCLLVVLLLAPAFAGAVERRSDGPAPKERVSLWQGRLLPALWGLLTRIWEENGSSLDPSGQPRPDEGSSLDPSGSTADEGGSLDPSGGV